jgi:6,7-dimethyl-8-ribityllumazine synthase
MASSLKNLSDYAAPTIDLSGKRFALVVSSYHDQITQPLYRAACDTLLAEGAKPEHLITRTAPGTFELPLCAQQLAQRPDIDAVICIGCVIQGETRHFDFICQAVADGLMQVGLRFGKPVIFGVLTPNTLQQALDRAGGKHGNKGVEAAAAAIGMLAFQAQA